MSAMLYYERVLEQYNPRGSEDDRRAVLTKLSAVYGVAHLETQLMILYRYLCHKKVSVTVLADAKWLLDR